MAVRVLFLGSNHEALETLKTLNEDESFNVVGVITQPDKPVGRKKEVIETKIKKYCIEKDLRIFYANNEEGKYREALEIFKPELVVCKSFGEILPEFFLDFPKYGSINIHFSLLPKYRGAVPIQMAILNGDQKTGISIIKMTKGLDNGDILTQFEEDIRNDDTNISLRERLVKKTAKELPDVLKRWISGKITLKKQNEKDVTYCWKKDISKEKAQIFWEKQTANEIDRMVRAFVPWPVAWTTINGKKTKIFGAKVNEEKKLKPKAFKTENLKLLIGCKKGTVEIKKLQMEGKKEMDVKEFLNGVEVLTLA